MPNRCGAEIKIRLSPFAKDNAVRRQSLINNGSAAGGGRSVSGSKPQSTGREDHLWRHRSISANALSAAAAHVAAPISIAAWKAAHSSAPAAASTAPSSAVAIRPPVRATALFNPDADPV